VTWGGEAALITTGSVFSIRDEVHFGSDLGIGFIKIENLVSDGIAEWLELQP